MLTRDKWPISGNYTDRIPPSGEAWDISNPASITGPMAQVMGIEDYYANRWESDLPFGPDDVGPDGENLMELWHKGKKQADTMQDNWIFEGHYFGENDPRMQCPHWMISKDCAGRMAMFAYRKGKGIEDCPFPKGRIGKARWCKATLRFKKPANLRKAWLSQWHWSEHLDKQEQDDWRDG